MEKAFIDFLNALVSIIGNLAKIFTDNEAWGVVAALFVLLAVVLYLVRKDRLTMDNKVSDLLEKRNDQVLKAFDKATNVVNAMSDLEDRIDILDQRCDLRQKQMRGRPGGQP